MTTHTAHELRLTDGCPRCDEAAANPTRFLDDDFLGHAVELAVRRDRFEVQPRPSDNEYVAAANCRTALEQVGRMLQANPDAVKWYFRDQWRVEL